MKSIITALIIFSLHYSLYVRKIFQIPLLVILLFISIIYLLLKRLYKKYLFYNWKLLVLTFFVTIIFIILGTFQRNTFDKTAVLRFIQYIYVSITITMLIDYNDYNIKKIFIIFSIVISLSFLISIISILLGGKLLEIYIKIKYWSIEFDDVDIENIKYTISGFSRQLPEFSYQILMSTCIMYYYLNSDNNIKINYLILLILSTLGLIIVGQRSAIISFIIYLFLIRNNIYSKNSKKYFFIGIFLLFVIINSNISNKYLNIYKVLDRFKMNVIKDDNRFEAAIIAFLSPFYEPIGNGDKSKYYIEYAMNNNFYNAYTKNINYSHNHFANIIMQTGFIGYIIIIIFLLILFGKKEKKENQYINKILLVLIINSFAHNTGFFTTELSTLVITTIINITNNKKI